MLPALEMSISNEAEASWFVGTGSSNCDAEYLRVTSKAVMPISTLSSGAMVTSKPLTVLKARAVPVTSASMVHAFGNPAFDHSYSY